MGEFASRTAAMEVTRVGTISVGAGTGGANTTVGTTPVGAEAGGVGAAGASMDMFSVRLSAGGAGVSGATESEKHGEQTQADQDLLVLITETFSPEVYHGVRVLLCCIIVCLPFTFIK